MDGMTIHLSITVMTHPSRYETYFNSLWEELMQDEQAFLRTKEEQGFEDTVTITYSSDTESEGVWTNAQRSWTKYEELDKVTHHMVLQDDISIAKDFIHGVIRALKVKNHEFICLYCPRKVILEAKEQDKSWAKIPDGCWGQGNVVPTHLIPIMMNWFDKHIDPAFPHDDSRFSLFLVENHMGSWVTVPSLIEHVGAGESLIGHSNRSRVAKWFLGYEDSASEIDWTKGANSPVHAPNGIMRSHYDAYYKYGVPEELKK